MKKGKATVSIGLIYVILLGVFNLLVFTIFKTHTKVFWLSYAFMTVAFIVQILSMFLSFKTADVETAFFGIPLASFSIYYLCASLIVGAVFMVFQNAGFTLALVIQTLILAAFLIIAIISLLARDTVQAIGENVKQNVTNLKSILVDVEMLSSSCTDPELKQALNKLADTVKYSDPMSTTAVELVEQRIMRKISELRVSIDNNQIPDALQVCNIYDTVHTIPLEDLLSKPTVIELNAINNKEQKSLIMALLLIMMCVYTKNNVAGDGKLKNVMLIDEAHVLLAGSAGKSDESADSQGSTIESLEDMIAEIRSYGTSIIIADQSPTKVGRNIVANTNVKVIFKLVEKENKDAISTATNMNEADYDLLGRLGVGEALLHYGRVYSPLHIKTYNVHDRAEIRDVISDTEIASMTTYWDSHQKLLIPHRECVHNGMCKDGCDFKLRSGADFVASRLVNTLLYDVADKTAFVKLLVQLDRPILEVLKDNPTITPSVRLSNCIKIKFLRKALLVKSFGITKAEYEMILKHPNFLKGGSRDA